MGERLKKRRFKTSWNRYSMSKEIPKHEKQFVLGMLDMIDDDALRFRISNLLIWYIDKSISNKRWYHFWSIITIVANISIPTINLLITWEYLNIANSIIAGIATSALAINGLMHYKDNWTKYRSSAEKVKQFVADYLIAVGDCNDNINEEEYDYSKTLKYKLVKKINQVTNEEHTEWFELYTNVKQDNKEEK